MQHLPDSHMVDHKKGVSTNFETLKSCIEPGLVGSMHDTGCLGLVHWDDPEGLYGEGRGRRGSGWGTRIFLWQIHVDVWKNQYNIVK